ncbi:hypothetical protein AAVH_19797 [Aphelenchoides avenae]|nr:hypothetical protein AAVH_19797 [Aphelenchus avenae]
MTIRSSAAWDYFKKLPDAMRCTVCPDGSQHAKLAGNDAGNAKKHLNFYHTIEYENTPPQVFLVDLGSDFICRLIADRMRNEDASETVSDAESAGADDDDYEEMMLKKRKLEKRLSSQARTPGHRSGSLTEAKEYINAVLYQGFRATEPLEW